MCGRFVLMTPGKDLAKRFGLEVITDLEPHYNIAPSQMVTVIRVDRHTLQRRLVQLKWGLIPSWVKDPSIGNRLINARAESVAEKPGFRSAFRFRRCLVLADGFYQWKKGKVGKRPSFLGWLMETPLHLRVFGKSGLDRKVKLSNHVQCSLLMQMRLCCLFMTECR